MIYYFLSAQIFYQEPPPPPGSVRPKRESFVDLDSIPKMMRGFAQNLGRGFNSMVQHSQKIASQGHKYAQYHRTIDIHKSISFATFRFQLDSRLFFCH